MTLKVDNIQNESASEANVVLNSDGSISIPSQIKHVGDDNTLIEFETDTVKLQTAGGTRFIAKSDGKVGIGHESPLVALHVLGPVAGESTDTLRLSTAADNANVEHISIGFDKNVSDTHPMARMGVEEIDTGDRRGHLYFETRGANSDTAPTERMRITSDGNVVIGSGGMTDALLTVGKPDSAAIGFSRTGTGGGGQFDGAIELDSNGNFAFRNGSNSTTVAGLSTRMVINNSGLVGMNATNPGGHLEIGHDSSQTVGFIINNTSTGTMAHFKKSGTVVGSITNTTSATAYNTSSDYRLKENVVTLDGAITRVKQLQPKRFNFKVDADTTVDGFLAHEAQTVVPEAVTGTKDEVDADNQPVYQGIDQAKLVPLLTAALQEAITKIETLETKVAALEAG